ncbi:2-oxo acid dehydrogenase subunit E2 [Halovivax cerinus]|uniref:2-oxo acid dehydrogenase subunit E2 n=1 Tax=Halovivax cerinus TaxID=1487865 RepID=A0ABD5NRJ8_9EURY|nr:2-oxo acid dehydrogenase subunit E2 [Halovivax cerinus]
MPPSDTDPGDDEGADSDAPNSNAPDPDTPDPDATDESGRTIREERSLTPMRRTIAKRLSESYRNAVHVTASREIDAEALLAAAESADDRLDVDVSLIDLVLGAVSGALEAHPAFNATYEDETHRLYAEHNVGIAVDVDAGLVAPVVRDLGSLTLAEQVAERRRLTEAVRSGDYSMADLRGATFTVTNLGVLGVDSFTPVINPPEVAILGVGRLREHATPGEDGVEFRRRITFDLSFDHRVVDGADAARFLGTLAEHTQNAAQFVPGK